MNAVKREALILYYRWARHDLRRKPGDPGVSEVIIALNDLYGQRPRAKLRNGCERAWGMCLHDPRCADHDCSGHPSQLQQRDGGHAIAGSLALRLHPALLESEIIAGNRVRLGICGALWIALLWAAMRAAGIPVVPLF